MNLSINNITKTYGGKPVLKGISMDLERGELVSIVGPSGVGKTTLLRILAGLERQDAGEVQRMPDAMSWEPVIMVFQDFMLFPHITVRRNIAYGLESRHFYRRLFPDHADKKAVESLSPAFRRLRRERINGLVNHYVENFGLVGLEDKYPAQLSAGQRQRVSLARAMVIHPSLLLLDEPFANLDKNLKMETALFIRAMQQESGVSILAVTHDLQEAFAMSDRIAVMLHGEILQMSDVETLYRFPVTSEVGRFLGAINRLPEQLWPLCDFAGGQPSAPVGVTKKEGSILVRAESVDLIPDKTGHAIITEKRFQGTIIHIELELNKHSLVAYCLSSELMPGQRVRIRIRDYVDSGE